MKFVIDMNLGPDWIGLLSGGGHAALHWSSVGSADERDEQIMVWARQMDHVILTADLDFGSRLVRGRESAPSVVQLRTPVTVAHLVGSSVLVAIESNATALAAGALVTVETERVRVRRLTPFPTA